jgi:hypothetical protein
MLRLRPVDHKRGVEVTQGGFRNEGSGVKNANQANSRAWIWRHCGRGNFYPPVPKGRLDQRPNIGAHLLTPAGFALPRRRAGACTGAASRNQEGKGVERVCEGAPAR